MDTPRRAFVTLALYTPAAGTIVQAANSPATDAFPVATDLDLLKLLPPPPERGSARELAEIKTVQDRQAETPQARIDAAVADAGTDLPTLLAKLLAASGTVISSTFPLGLKFLGRIEASIEMALRPTHDPFARTPPWLADAGVKPLVPQIRVGAYPSPAAIRATLAAMVITDLSAARSRPVWQRARDYGESRIIGGMEYPSDVDAGERAGSALGAVLLGSPYFRAEFDAARPELRKAMGL